MPHGNVEESQRAAILKTRNGAYSEQTAGLRGESSDTGEVSEMMGRFYGRSHNLSE